MEKYMGPIIYGSIIFAIIQIVANWFMYVKAGKPGWASLIPVYNWIVLLQIAGKQAWWVLLMLVPVVNIVVLVITMHNLSLSFGQGTWFTIGLIFLWIIVVPVLAFSDIEYIGPGGVPNTQNQDTSS